MVATKRGGAVWKQTVWLEQDNAATLGGNGVLKKSEIKKNCTTEYALLCMYVL